MTELTCTWVEFKRMAKEFHEAAPTLSIEELDHAWKCLGLGYLNMSEPMWLHSAAALLKIETRRFLECEEKLENNLS